MGYEVLDAADGVAGRVSSSPYPSSEIVALDDLPTPTSSPEPRRPRAPRPMLTWLRTGPARRVWVLVTVAALLGIGVGSWWTKQRAEQLQRLQAQSVVRVFASADSVDPSMPSQGGRFADITVRVVNLGPLPVTVAISPGTARPAVGSPTVAIVSGVPEVRSGDEALARIRLRLDCTSDRPLSPTLPVTTADGRTHQLPLRAGVNSTKQVIPRDLCANGMGEQALDASLAGTMTSPVLVLRNTSEQPLVVSLDSGSPLTQYASTFLALTTVPALPINVPAHGATRLQLRLTVTGCRQNAADLASLGQYGYLGFQGESPAGPLMGGTANAGVDVNALIGAAMARSCQRSAG